MASVRSSIATRSRTSSAPIELIRKVSEAYSVAGCPSVDSTKRTHAWTRSSSRVRSIAPVTSATSSTPALSVTGPSSAGGGSALAGTVATASNPRTRAARTTARRIRGSVESSGSVAAGRCRWVHRRGATLRARCSRSARAHARIRWRGAPSAASSSRCRGRLQPVPGGGPLRRRRGPGSDPSSSRGPLRRPTAWSSCGRPRRRRVQRRPGCSPPVPRQTPTRSASPMPPRIERPRSVSTSPMTRTTTASSVRTGACPEHVPKEGKVWLAMMGVVGWHRCFGRRSQATTSAASCSSRT